MLPPQSMSVSLLFFLPSVQVGAQTPPVQTPPMQSPGSPQNWPVAQGGHIAPPQSTSDSPPFFFRSPQPAGAHLNVAGSHTMLAQSPSTTQSTHVEAAVHFWLPFGPHGDSTGLAGFAARPW